MKGMIYKDLLNIKTQIIYYSAAIEAITVVSLFQNNIYFLYIITYNILKEYS